MLAPDDAKDGGVLPVNGSVDPWIPRRRPQAGQRQGRELLAEPCCRRASRRAERAPAGRSARGRSRRRRGGASRVTPHQRQPQEGEPRVGEREPERHVAEREHGHRQGERETEPGPRRHQHRGERGGQEERPVGRVERQRGSRPACGESRQSGCSASGDARPGDPRRRPRSARVSASPHARTTRHEAPWRALRPKDAPRGRPTRRRRLRP